MCTIRTICVHAYVVVKCTSEWESFWLLPSLFSLFTFPHPRYGSVNALWSPKKNSIPFLNLCADAFLYQTKLIPLKNTGITTLQAAVRKSWGVTRKPVYFFFFLSQFSYLKCHIIEKHRHDRIYQTHMMLLWHTIRSISPARSSAIAPCKWYLCLIFRLVAVLFFLTVIDQFWLKNIPVHDFYFVLFKIFLHIFVHSTKLSIGIDRTMAKYTPFSKHLGCHA